MPKLAKTAVIRDKLARFLYWAAYRLERAADRMWYGRGYEVKPWPGSFASTLSNIVPGTPITWQEDDLS